MGFSNLALKVMQAHFPCVLFIKGLDKDTTSFRRGHIDPIFDSLNMKKFVNIFVKHHHGQRSLVGYSPRGHKESDMTE